MSTGRVVFVGCGPGAADLLTLRATHAMRDADIIIWNRALLDEDALAEHAAADAEILVWPPATARDVVASFDRARTEQLVVVRLTGGDPTLFGVMGAELAAVRERGLVHEIVPGISAASATAAALGREIAQPGTALLLACAPDLGGDDGALVRVAVWNAGRDPAGLQRALFARGLAADTRCSVAVDVSRNGEMLVACRLDELAETVADLGLGALTFVLADPAVNSGHDEPREDYSCGH